MMTEANAPESVGAMSDNAPAQSLESPARISDRLRHRLRTTGAAIASLAAVGAVISGLAGYWSTWKLVKNELSRDGQSVQREAVARPDVAPRLSPVVLPFVNLNNEAKDLFDAAPHIDQDNLDATIGKAWCMALDVINGWSTSASDDKRDAAELIDRALLRRPSSAIAHVVKGETLYNGNPEGALREYEAALEIDPNAPIAQFRKGSALILTGRAREAFSPLQIALRLSPRDPLAFAMHYNICHAHTHLREYDNAINACRQSLSLNKANWFPYVDLVSIYGNTGQLEQAQQALAELNAIRSGFTVQWFHDLGYAYSSNQQFRREFDDILDGLRKGGVREG